MEFESATERHRAVRLGLHQPPSALKRAPLDKANGVQDNRAPRAPSRTSHSKSLAATKGETWALAKRIRRTSSSASVGP